MEEHKKIAIETVMKYPLSTFKSILNNVPELYFSTSPTIYSLFFSKERYKKWNKIIQSSPEFKTKEVYKNYLKRFSHRYVHFLKEEFYLVPVLLITNKILNLTIILCCIIFIYKSFIYKKYNKYKKLTYFLFFYILILTLVAIISAEGRFRLGIMPGISILGSLYLINNYKVKKIFDIYKNKARNYIHR